MAITRCTQSGAIEYAVPQALIDATPNGMGYRHFAWFRRDTGRCMLEWAGYVERPDVDQFSGDREHALKVWQDHVTQHLAEEHRIESWVSPRYDPLDGDVFYACVDVTRFQWPVGDHRWHYWDDIDHRLDWPAASVRRFMEVRIDEPDIDVVPIVGVLATHRPLRDAVPGQRAFMLSGTPLEALMPRLPGMRFVRRGNRWTLEDPMRQLPRFESSVTRALAPIVQVKELV